MKSFSVITYDIPNGASGSRTPAIGDWLRTVSRTDGATLTVYLIQDVREVKRRVVSTSRRFSLMVQKGYTVQDIGAEFSWRLHWYSRGKGRGKSA